MEFCRPMGAWNVITLKGKAKKGLTVDEVHQLVADAGYMRERQRPPPYPTLTSGVPAGTRSFSQL
jgi:hypothetical protein